MRTFSSRGRRCPGIHSYGKWGVMTLLFASLGTAARIWAEDLSQTAVSDKIQQLSEAMAKTQAQLEESQQQLDAMRKELSELKHLLPNSNVADRGEDASHSDSSTQSNASKLAAAVADLQERQTMAESQIATHDQTKVESVSKYPVKITGMLLLNGFINTGAVDMAATPTVAVPGGGSAGATIRQTILGFDANGPHVFGARSYADLRVDFDATSTSPSALSAYTGYFNSNSSFLRLRTAHAGLQWDHTAAYFSLDRPIISPDSPTSLTAVAEPALAWSGNLWAWNPQAGVTQKFGNTGSRGVVLQAALIDPADAPLSPEVGVAGTATTVPPNSVEQNSRPGVEARIGLVGTDRDDSTNHVGVGGYFARHQSALGRTFDSWAGTFDLRMLLFSHFKLTGEFYRGLGLGGLGEGGYKDFAYRSNPNTGGYFMKPLDDVGGWAELKQKINERLEFNEAYGMDSVFASQMKRYIVAGGTMYQNLTINRTFTGNVIYSPSAYLLLSVEYRHMESSPIAATPARSNVIGVGAGYKF